MTEEINIFPLTILWDSYLQLFHVRNKLNKLQQEFNPGANQAIKLHERELYILHLAKDSEYFLARMALSPMCFV